MNGKILTNILSKNEIDELIAIRDSMNNSRLDRKKGRKVSPLSNKNLLSSTIREKLSLIASEYSGRPMEFHAVAFGRYSNEFGIPKLLPHIDEVPSQTTLDYQLDGNTKWSIIIEGVEYILNNNDALLFEGENVLHWRPEKVFKDGEFLDLLWFQFVDKNHWSHFSDMMPNYNDFKQKVMLKIKKLKEGKYEL